MNPQTSLLATHLQSLPQTQQNLLQTYQPPYTGSTQPLFLPQTPSLQHPLGQINFTGLHPTQTQLSLLNITPAQTQTQPSLISSQNHSQHPYQSHSLASFHQSGQPSHPAQQQPTQFQQSQQSHALTSTHNPFSLSIINQNQPQLTPGSPATNLFGGNSTLLQIQPHKQSNSPLQSPPTTALTHPLHAQLQQPHITQQQQQQSQQQPQQQQQQQQQQSQHSHPSQHSYHSQQPHYSQQQHQQNLILTSLLQQHQSQQQPQLPLYLPIFPSQQPHSQHSAYSHRSQHSHQSSHLQQSFQFPTATTARDLRDQRGHQARSLMQSSAAPTFPLINPGEPLDLTPSLTLFDQLYLRLIFLHEKSFGWQGDSNITQSTYESALCYASAQLLRIYFELCNNMYEDSIIRYPSPELHLHELPDSDKRSNNSEYSPRLPFSHNKPLILNNNHHPTASFYFPTSLCPELVLSTIIPLDPVEVVARLGPLPATILSRLHRRVHGSPFNATTEKVGSFEYLVRLTKLNQMGLTPGQLLEVEGLGTMGARMNRIRKNVYDRWILVTKTSPEADTCVAGWITQRLPQLTLQSHTAPPTNQQTVALAFLRQCLPQGGSQQDMIEYQLAIQQSLLSLAPNPSVSPILDQVCVVRGTKRKTASLRDRNDYHSSLLEGYKAFQTLYPNELADLPPQRGIIYPRLALLSDYLEKCSNDTSVTPMTNASINWAPYSPAPQCTLQHQQHQQQQQYQQLTQQQHHQFLSPNNSLINNNQPHGHQHPLNPSSTPLPFENPGAGTIQPPIIHSVGNPAVNLGNTQNNPEMTSNSSAHTNQSSQLTVSQIPMHQLSLRRNNSTLACFDSNGTNDQQQQQQHHYPPAQIQSHAQTQTQPLSLLDQLRQPKMGTTSNPPLLPTINIQPSFLSNTNGMPNTNNSTFHNSTNSMNNNLIGNTSTANGTYSFNPTSDLHILPSSPLNNQRPANTQVGQLQLNTKSPQNYSDTSSNASVSFTSQLNAPHVLQQQQLQQQPGIGTLASMGIFTGSTHSIAGSHNDSASGSSLPPSSMNALLQPNVANHPLFPHMQPQPQQKQQPQPVVLSSQFNSIPLSFNQNSFGLRSETPLQNQQNTLSHPLQQHQQQPFNTVFNNNNNTTSLPLSFGRQNTQNLPQYQQQHHNQSSPFQPQQQQQQQQQPSLLYNNLSQNQSGTLNFSATSDNSQTFHGIAADNAKKRPFEHLDRINVTSTSTLNGTPSTINQEQRNNNLEIVSINSAAKPTIRLKQEETPTTREWVQLNPLFSQQLPQQQQQGQINPVNLSDQSLPSTQPSPHLF